MTRFLKLTGRIINTSYITRIQHEMIKDTSAYVIYTSELDFSGSFMFGFGWVDNRFTKIQILENENEKDYMKIKKFVDYAIMNDLINMDNIITNQIKGHNKDCL
jgi:hypothetical protein